MTPLPTFKKRMIKTRHISIDVRKCRSCWKCLEACSQDVLAAINFLSHHHIRLKNPQNCTGCARCVKACPHQAITKLSK